MIRIGAYLAAVSIAVGGVTVATSARQRAAPPSLSSLGKQLDEGHQNVVAVFADRPLPAAATATLVDPRAVITAGHVSPRRGAAFPPWIVSFGAHLTSPSLQMRVTADGSSRPHPSFLAFVDENGRNPNERPDFLDVGLVLLPEAAAGFRPMALPAAHVLDHLSKTDRTIGVGYGYHEVINARTAGFSQTADGSRRSWRVGITILNDAWIRLNDDPSKGYGQICRGDSGAPILLERNGRETIVAVVSHSDGQDCGPGVPTYAVRVDNPAVLEWINAEIGQRPSSGR